MWLVFVSLADVDALAPAASPNLGDKFLTHRNGGKAISSPTEKSERRIYQNGPFRCNRGRLRIGTVTSSLILRKLASYPRQNGLAVALREFGRIERTLFTLDWLLDKNLRQRVTAGLNEGEPKNTLAKPVCFNCLGELRDRSFEAQHHRVSGLNLVVATIILWNTVYLDWRSDRFASRVAKLTTVYSSIWRPSIGTTST